MKKLLIVNPGSTSTKVAVYCGSERKFSETISHPAQELQPFANVLDQADYRAGVIARCLGQAGLSAGDMDGVIAIGGLLKPVDSGVYRVNKAMLRDLRSRVYGEHAANLGAVIADGIGRKYGLPAFVGDPITVDEMQPLARVSGHPLLPRYGRTHTLNHKRVARTVAQELGKPYEQCRLVVAHLGGGTSVAAHCGGRMIDSASSRGEGAFSMDRSGQLNAWELAKLCFSGRYEKAQVLKMLNGQGGVFAYLGTKDFRQVEELRNQGDETASAVFEALAYQVAKEIAAMTAVLSGQVDAIVLTGGVIYSQAFRQLLLSRISYLGRVICKPGEEEMDSLAYYLNAVLTGELQPKEYN